MCLTPRRLTKIETQESGLELEVTYEVPCGLCYQCITDRRISWTVRNLIEMKYSVRSYFVTLTYSDLSELEYDYRANLYVANKLHYQNFLKRFRKKYGSCLRYFGAHEYGLQTFRPHYHFIFYLSKNVHLTQDTLASLWSHGNVTIDECNQARIHYLTKYILKYVDRVKYDKLGRPYTFRSLVRGSKDETVNLRAMFSDKVYRDVILFENSFNLFSLKPAIGFQLFDDKEYCAYIRRYALDNLKYPPLFFASRSYKLPRYYIKKLFSDEERRLIYDEYREVGFSNERNVKLSQETNLSIADLKESAIFANRKRLESLRVRNLNSKVID